jgi:amino acid transporter
MIKLMQINFFLRIRGLLFVTLIILSISAIAINNERNEDIYDSLTVIMVLIAFYYPIFIFNAIKNYFLDRWHENLENKPDRDILKYTSGVFLLLTAYSIFFYVPLTPEEEKQRERKQWAMKRERGAPLLSDRELLEGEIRSVCFNSNFDAGIYPSGKVMRACEERFRRSKSKLNMTSKQKKVRSIRDWCHDWRKLSYESRENCIKDQKESYGISD